jgi:hypothetical protein
MQARVYMHQKTWWKKDTPVSMPHTPVNDEKQAKCTANSKEKS